MRISERQRRQFTRQEPYPAGATGTPRKRWLLAVLMVGLGGGLAWIVGDQVRESRAARQQTEPPQMPLPQMPEGIRPLSPAPTGQ